MDILKMKNELLDLLNAIDKNDLSLMDLRLYAETLKIVSEIQTKSYAEVLADTMSEIRASCLQPAQPDELKGVGFYGI